MASGGHSSSRCVGLALSRPLLLRSTGSRRAGSVVVAHGPSCSTACGILPDQGPNPCPLHWQADSQPLRHQGSPKSRILRYLLPEKRALWFFCRCISSSFLLCVQNESQLSKLDSYHPLSKVWLHPRSKWVSRGRCVCSENIIAQILLHVFKIPLGLVTQEKEYKLSFSAHTEGSEHRPGSTGAGRYHCSIFQPRWLHLIPSNPAFISVIG